MFEEASRAPVFTPEWDRMRGNPARMPLASIDFGWVARVVLRQWRIILATMVAAMLAMGLFILLVTPQFTAATEILINPTDLRAIENGLINNNQLSDANIVQVESQVRVITSDSVLRRVVDKEHLDQDAEFVGDGPSILRKLLSALLTPFGLTPTTGTFDPTLEALTELRKRVGVRRAERTYVVDATVTTRDPAKSARIANAIAKAYITEQMSASSEAARRVSDSLSARLAELRKKVRDAEERVEQYKSRNNILDSGGQLVNERQLNELNNHLMLARAREGEAKARFDQIRALQQGNIDAAAVPEAVQSPTITALRSQYAVARRQESELRTTLGARHPALVEVRAQVATLQQLIREEIGRIGDSVRNDYERAQANEKSLERSLDVLKRGAVTTNEALVPLRELEREVQTSRAVYESFLVRARETGEQEQLDTKNIRIISRADLPMRRSWPPRNLVLMLGAMMFGAAAGTGLAFLRQPRGGGTPAAPALPSSPSFPLLAALPPNAAWRGLEVLSRPRSQFAAQIRAVAAAMRRCRGNTTHQCVLVVSATDDGGAAMVALNLAAESALRQRVLVIDADSRRSAISKLLPDAPDTALMQPAKGGRPMADRVSREERTQINIISLASANLGPNTDFSPDDIRDAFEMAKSFDLVIVTAPIRRGDRNARLFGSLTDQVVLVIDARDTHEHSLADVFASLDGNEGKMLGVVVTNADTPADSFDGFASAMPAA